MGTVEKLLTAVAILLGIGGALVALGIIGFGLFEMLGDFDGGLKTIGLGFVVGVASSIVNRLASAGARMAEAREI